MLARILALWLAFFPSLAFGQSAVLNGFPPGTFQSRAAIDAPISASYVGPGDVSGTIAAFYSCARVVSAAKANTSTNLCDLTDATTGTVAIGTLRGTTTGKVDLSAYFAGAVTPATACAAAAGGACRVSKAYNQVNPGTLDAISSGTHTQDPTLTFAALNSLPGMTCTIAAASRLLSSTTYTQALPVSFATVGNKTASSSAAFIGSSVAGPVGLIGDGTNLWGASAGTIIGQAATDTTFHAGQAVLLAANNTSSFISVDGTSTSGAVGTSAFAAGTVSICRANGVSLPGTVMEGILWGSDQTANTAAVNTNAHGTNGYNF